MRVELGNQSPIEIVDGQVRSLGDGPVVTTMNVRENATYEVAKRGSKTDVNGSEVGVESARELAGEISMHLMSNSGQTSHMPGQEAAIEVVRTWASHSDKPPIWVRCDDGDFEVLLSHLFQAPILPAEEA